AVHLKLLEVSLANEISLGKAGQDGVDGKVGVNGKDGASVVLNGKDGLIGLMVLKALAVNQYQQI
ncbi:hypothetical protein GEW_13566, partial [Pasteurella multocida subsp. gallicida str. Anand1_poultry]